MESNKVSIVVPLYNKEDHISAVLESLLNSSYRNREIIIVEDGSTDRSPEVARSFMESGDVRIIRHEVNQGLSAARNTGLAAATGTFVQFWDADDIYDPEGLGRIVAEMEEDEADIGTGVAYRDGRPLQSYVEPMLSVRATTFAETPAAARNDSACFKVYRRNFLMENGLRFVPGLYMQDIEFNIRALPLARSITVTPHRLGEYVRTEGSGSRNFGQARFESALEIDRLTREFYAAHGLQAWEPFRQARILTAVFTPFLVHALRRMTSGYTYAGGHSHHIDGPERAWVYVDRFRRATEGLTEGISLVMEKDPGVALGFIALREGALDQVLPLLHGTKPDPSFPRHFPSTDLLTWPRISDGATRLKNPVNKFAWRPMC